MSTNTVKESVNRQFSDVAGNYATSAVHAAGVDLAAMVQAAELTGRERVLDAGCGAGHTALAFAPYAAEVVALDLSAEMLGQVCTLAEQRGLANIRTEQGDVEHLAFSDAEFDLVTSRYSAHHWPHPQIALGEIRRVLRPTGRFLLSDVVSFDDFTADTFVQALELLRDPSHVRDHTPAQWLAMLDEAGFRGETLLTWPLRLDFASWVERMATPPENVAMLRRLLGGAPHEVRTQLAVEADHSFTFVGALFQGSMTQG